MKRLFLSFLMSLALLPSFAGNLFLPDDFLCIEQLIAIHKLMKEGEDKALKHLSGSAAVQNLNTDYSQQMAEARVTLNSKIAAGHEWVVLVSALADTGNDLKSLIKEMEGFIDMAKRIAKTPMSVQYCGNAYDKIMREIPRMKTLVTSVVATKGGLVKASMEERINIINSIKRRIGSCREIISSARYICMTSTGGQWVYNADNGANKAPIDWYSGRNKNKNKNNNKGGW